MSGVTIVNTPGCFLHPGDWCVHRKEPRSMSTRTPARRAVEKWLAQWGIRNDGELASLLDAMERRDQVWPSADCAHVGLHDHLVEGGYVGPWEGPHTAEPR